MYSENPKNPKNPTPSHEQMERRAYRRISKNFIMTYYDKKMPDKKFEITQLRNISMGGMCFITTDKIKPGTHLSIELKTPYLTDTTYLEGPVLESHEKIKNMIFETRLKFESLSKESEYLLQKLIEYFTNEEDKDNE